MTGSSLLPAIENDLTARTWAEIDLGAIRQNVQSLKQFFRGQTEIMAVIKANAYGLGAVEVGRSALEGGASSLAVASCEEGLHLRVAGLDHCPVVVLGYIPSGLLADAVAADLTVTVDDPQTACILSREAQKQRTSVSTQLKLDTGMHRAGLTAQDALRLAQLVTSLPNLRLEGLYTHFATGDEEDSSFVLEQHRRYREARDLLQAHGFNFPYEHSSNSAASIRVPEVRGSIARVGIALLGYYPSEVVAQSAAQNGLTLQPSLTLKSTIVRLHTVEPGETVGYSRIFTADKPTLVALVPTGYADGYRRELSNRADALVEGKRARVIGRVSMDQLTLDVSNIPGVQVGDEVVLMGQQGQENISLEEIAGICGTIGYEILTGLGNRVKRVYLD